MQQTQNHTRHTPHAHRMLQRSAAYFAGSGHAGRLSASHNDVILFGSVLVGGNSTGKPHGLRVQPLCIYAMTMSVKQAVNRDGVAVNVTVQSGYV